MSAPTRMGPVLQPAQQLDPLTLPLHGSRLIEASAGTGKTWTISALYVRLVLGHGGPNAFGRPLMPADILVMTFTRAATRELSDRIRARLVQAAQWLRQTEAGQPVATDPFMASLLASIEPGQARQDAAWRLAMAADAMDDAAVFTIDAWCQRVLREHAFDSGQLFDETLVADEQALRLQAVQDHWRQHVYPLSAEKLEALRACPTFQSLDALAADLDSLLKLADADTSHPAARALAAQPLWRVWENAQAQRAAALGQLRATWLPQARAMQDWLADQTSTRKKDWQGRLLSASTTAKWIEMLVNWAAASDGSDTPDLPALTSTAWERLTPDGLAKARADGAAPLQVPPEFEAFAGLQVTLAALPSVCAAVRAHAVACVGQRMALLKQRTGQFGFQDMLTRLDTALARPSSGERLRQHIRQQYPVALVDEFQDTSPLQYRLFDQIYNVAGAGLNAGAASGDEGRCACALLLIGDPKQSIYGFRGADIDSYLNARNATEGRHHVLGTNHRSSQAMVDVVNRLFAWRETAPGVGAFRYRQPPSPLAPPPAGGTTSAPTTHAAQNPLPFLPVAAKGRDDVWVHNGTPAPALTVEVDTTLHATADLRRLFAARCAEQVVGWLNDPATGFESPEGPPGGQRFARLRPADVAVLVRSGVEARAVRRALYRRGVASVYLSDRESVFKSTEATDLLHWLQAVAHPRDARLVRAGLATQLVGLTLAEMAALASNDDALDARMAQLDALRTVWQQRGVQAMLRQTLQRLALPSRWLQTPEGERRLTNLLHLAELLQAASAGLDGEQALIRWLHAETQAHDVDNDEQVVRLESDADLVKVITVHKSKGLEYPVVCLPFATGFRSVGKDKLGFVREAGPDGRAALRLHITDDDVVQADEARLREDLRLLYVALTRARHAVWLGFGAVKDGRKKGCQTHRSALGYVLAGQTEPDANDWWAAWHHGPFAAYVGAAAPLDHTESALTQQATHPGPVCVRQAAEEPGQTMLARDEQLPALRTSQTFQASFERDWKVGSFTSLVRDLPSAVSDLRPQPHNPAGDEFLNESLHLPHTSVDFVAIKNIDFDDALEHKVPLRGQLDLGFDAVSDDVAAEAVPLSTLAPAPAAASASARAAAAALTDQGGTPAFWHGFQRGPLAGNFLHDQLEWLATEGFALPDPALPGDARPRAGGETLTDALTDTFASHPLVRRLVVRSEQAGHGLQALAIADWLARVVSLPLPLGLTQPVSLRQLGTLLPEMAFWLPAHRLQATLVDQLCRTHVLDALHPGLSCPALPARQLHGMLMGFADLVFEHGGRYWVLDYKSNHLGTHGADYTAEAMATEMARHRYDVQAALYMLALHRLLQSRLGAAYRPATHLGGAVYLFVRGIDGPATGVCLVPPVPELLDALAAQLDETTDGAGDSPGNPPVPFAKVPA